MLVTAPIPLPLVVDDLLRPEYAHLERFELRNGKLVELPFTGHDQNSVGFALAFCFGVFCKQHEGFHCSHGVDGFAISPSDYYVPAASQVYAKRRNYFAHGTEQVWTRDRKVRVLEVLHKDFFEHASTGIYNARGFAAGLEVNLDDVFDGKY